MKIILYGTIFKRNDADAAVKLSYTAENKAVAKFTVSEPRKFGRTAENKLDFWDFTCFGKQAEFLEKNFPAGKPIAIIGDAYHSKDDKGKTYLNLVASEVDFLPKEYGEFEAQVQSPETRAMNQQTAPVQNQAPVQQQPVTQQTQQFQPVQQAVQQTAPQAQQTAPQAQPVAQQTAPQAQPVVQQTAPQAQPVTQATPVQQPAPQPAPQQVFQTPPAEFDPFA